MIRVRIRRYLLALPVLAVVVAAAIRSWIEVREARAEIRCKETLGRELYDLVHQPDDLLASPAAVAGSADIAKLACAASGRPYVYRGIEGRVIQGGQSVSGRTLFRVIACCPGASHKGNRVILLENGAVHLLSDAAFQRATDAGYLCENRSDPAE